MLTDRQNKFLIKMIDLSQSSNTTKKEKTYLNRSIKDIQNGGKFQDGINRLTLSLKGLVKRTEKPLTPELDLFYKDLISAYGEPDYRFLNSLPDNSGILSTIYFPD